MKTLLIFLLATILVGLALSEYVDASNALFKDQLTYTKSICDRAYAEIDGASETECGRMQDVTNTEYICNQYACYLELK